MKRMSFPLAVLVLGLMTHSTLAQQKQSAEEHKEENANQESANALHTLHGHTDLVSFMAFSPDGKSLASASYDKTVKLWDAVTGKERFTLQGHASGVVSLAFSPDGTTLASGSNDGTVKLWDVATGKERTTLLGHRGHFITFVAYGPDGKTLASRSCGSKVKLWEVATGKERATFHAHSVTYSPEGKTLAWVDENGAVKLWDTVTGTERTTLRGHDAAFVAYSPDGKTLASASEDNNVFLWEITTGKERATLRVHHRQVFSVVFSPDGKTLATRGSDKTVQLLDLATGEERATLNGHSDQVTMMVYSPDGRILATGSHDDSVKLWDVATRKVQATLQGHTDAVVSVSFSPDCKTLATASHDKTVKLWSVPLIKKAESARSIILYSEDLDSLWTTLASDDAVRAFHAIGTLVRTPEQAVSLAKKRLRPASKPDGLEVTRWISDLDSDRYAIRDKSSKELAKMGEQAEAALRKELAGNPSPEVRHGIERLLSRLEQPSLELLRDLRAVEVLEHIGDSQAKKVLEILAGGEDSFRLTKEAKSSLDRLNKRLAAEK